MIRDESRSSDRPDSASASEEVPLRGFGRGSLALCPALPSGFLGLAASVGSFLLCSVMLVRLFVVVDALPTEEEQNLSSIVRPYRQFTALPRCREAGYHPPKGNVRPRGTI
jgi:hypothetical protein